MLFEATFLTVDPYMRSVLSFFFLFLAQLLDDRSTSRLEKLNFYVYELQMKSLKKRSLRKFLKIFDNIFVLLDESP